MKPSYLLTLLHATSTLPLNTNTLPRDKTILLLHVHMLHGMMLLFVTWQDAVWYFS